MKDRVYYFEVIKLLDEVFPPKNEFDYTKISADELIEKFDTAIGKINYNFSSIALQQIHRDIRSIQQFIYQRETNIEGKKDDNEFNQNNFFIQHSVSKMRNTTLSTLLNRVNQLQLADGDSIYNPLYFGDFETIKEIVNPENIKKVVIDTLTITSSSSEVINNSQFDLRAVIRDIFYHFGLKVSNGFITETPEYRQAFALMQEVIKNSIRGSGRILNGDSDNGYQQTYEHYNTDMASFNLQKDQAIKKIIQLITTVATSSLRKTEEFLENSEKIKRMKEQEKAEEPEYIEDEELDQKVERTAKKYELLQRLSSQNLQLANDLEKVNDDLAKAEAKYKALKEKKQAIEQQMADNDERMKRGL